MNSPRALLSSLFSRLVPSLPRRTAPSSKPEDRKSVEALEARIAPAALVALDQSNHLYNFDSESPGTNTIVTVSGLGPNEVLVGIDYRPATGGMYGLSVDPAGNGRVYLINPDTGAAAFSAQLAADPSDPTAPYTSLLGSNNFGFDFNPVADRLRLITSTGQNLRINVDTGLVITDADINPSGHVISGAAYTNSFAGATSTTLLDLDSVDNTFFQQNPPNNGTLVATPSDFIGDLVGVAGFDILSNRSANGTVTDTGYFAATGGAGGYLLLTLNPITGSVGSKGPITGASPLTGLTARIAPPSGNAYTVDSTTKHLLRFNTATPGVITDVGFIANLQDESAAIIGFDFRPATGQLYLVTKNGTLGRLYTVDTNTAAATLVGNLTANGTDATNPFTGLNGTFYGVDFNPVADALRIVSNGSENLRVNVTNATVITDDPLTGSATGATAAAYANNFAGATSTTLYDVGNFSLFVQSPPNSGVLTPVGPLSPGGAEGLLPQPSNGFDIGTNGEAFATFTFNGQTSLFKINLSTGLATPVGPLGNGLFPISGLALVPGSSLQFTAASYNIDESGGTVTINRLGNTEGVVSVLVTPTGGTALPGSDFIPGSRVITFGPGVTSRTIPVPVIDDPNVEGPEAFNLTLSGPLGNAVVIGPSTAEVNILDNDVVLADVALTGKTDGVESTTPGSTLTYAIGYINNGTGPAANVKITETLPTGTSFNAGLNPGWSLDAGVLTYNLGTLTGGVAGSVNLVLTVDNAAAAGLEQIVNKATISTSDLDGNSENNSATDTDTLIAAPDLNVTKTNDVPFSVARGAVIHYTINYSNTGDQNATGVSLIETLPANTSFLAGDSDPNWVLQGDGTYKLAIGDLAGAGGSGSAIFAVQVASGIPTSVKTITNTASVDDDGTNSTADVGASTTLDTLIYQGIAVVGSDRGDSRPFPTGARPFFGTVRVYDIATGLQVRSFLAYESNYRWGVRVATGDVNGDGYDDIFTATGKGTGRIRVFDGLTGDRLAFGGSFELNPFTSRARDGAHIAVGDLNNDGFDDLVVGESLGGKRVLVYDGKTGSLADSLVPFEKRPAGVLGTRLVPFTGGVRVAVGDVNGDGVADIIAGMGKYGGRIKAYAGGFDLLGNDRPILHDFQTGYRGGVFVAAGDLTGDGKAEIVVGNGGKGSPDITVFDPTDVSAPLFTRFVSESAFEGGMRVAVADVNLDGVLDIIAGTGVRGGSVVFFIDGVTRNTASTFTAFPERLSMGLFVAGSAPVPSVRPPDDNGEEQPPGGEGPPPRE